MSRENIDQGRRNIIRALGGAGLLSLIPGCSEMHVARFFYNNANSTRHERHALDMGITAEKVMKNKTGYFVEDGKLWTRMSSRESAADEYGIDLSWDSSYMRDQSPNDTIIIGHRDTADGSWLYTRQIIAPNQTIGTPWDTGRKEDRVQAEDREISDTTTDIFALARQAGYHGPIHVGQGELPFGQKTYQHFRGVTGYTDFNDGNVNTGVVPVPIRLGIMARRFNVGVDAKYAVVTVPRGNFEAGFNAMMIVADAQKARAGDPAHDMDMLHKSVATFIEADPWVKSRQTLQEVGGWINDLTGVSDALEAADRSIDIGLRRNHLERNNRPGRSGVDRAANAIGKFRGVTEPAAGIKGDLGVLRE